MASKSPIIGWPCHQVYNRTISLQNGESWTYKNQSVSYMVHRNVKRRRETHRIELWSKSPFESDILNALRRDLVNSVVEIRVNESLSYMDISIKWKTPSFRVTVKKWVSIPGDWPKYRDRTLFCRYVIRDESEESNRNYKFIANVVFVWWHIRTQEG